MMTFEYTMNQMRARYHEEITQLNVLLRKEVIENAKTHEENIKVHYDRYVYKRTLEELIENATPETQRETIRTLQRVKKEESKEWRPILADAKKLRKKAEAIKFVFREVPT